MVDAPKNYLEMYPEELNEEIKAAEQAQSVLTDFAGQVGTWYETQRLNVFGRLTNHIDEELKKAENDLNEQNQELNVDFIPDEQLRIDYRKKFHSTLLGRFRFNFAAAAALLGIPAIIDFLDGIKYWSPIGPAIYFIIGPAVSIGILIFVLVRRAKKGREKWPGKRMAKWLVLGLLAGLLISFWPLVGFWVRVGSKSSFMPSAWSILGVSIGWFLLTFVVALLKYHEKYRDYFDDIWKAHELLKWARNGSLNVRTSIRRLELTRKQVLYWADMLGAHLRNPWRVSKVESSNQDWQKFATSFPPSIRVAQAMESPEDGSRRPVGIERIINEIAAGESRKGWRKENFKLLLKTAPSYSATGAGLADNIDRDSPSAPNGSRDELDRLVRDEDFLTIIGSIKRESLIKSVQDKVLEAADLEVSAFQPGRGQRRVLNWDDHLSLAIDEQNLGAQPLADFAVRKEFLIEGYTNRVISFISGPSRIIRRVEANAEKGVPSDINLIELQVEGQRNIDLVLRLDIAGLEQVIPPKALALPISGDENFEAEDQAGYCYNCGMPDCVSLSTGVECPKTGI